MTEIDEAPSEMAIVVRRIQPLKGRNTGNNALSDKEATSCDGYDVRFNIMTGTQSSKMDVGTKDKQILLCLRDWAGLCYGLVILGKALPGLAYVRAYLAALVAAGGSYRGGLQLQFT